MRTPKIKIFRVAIAGRVTPDIAQAIGKLADEKFNGKTSLAIEFLIKRGLPLSWGFDVSLQTTEMLKRLAVQINGELAMRENRTPKPSQTPEFQTPSKTSQ